MPRMQLRATRTGCCSATSAPTRGMTIAVAADHRARDRRTSTRSILRDDDDLTKMVFRVDATEGSTIRLEKTVAYHSSRGVPVRELSDRCDRTLDRAARHGRRPLPSPSSAPGTTDFWEAADVEIDGDDPELPGASSRRSASTCSRSPRPPAAPTGWASRPRASPAPATRATTSGTPRSTSCRSSATPSPRWPATLLHFRALMLPAARAPGPRDGAERRAVPVAHDQRRGGVGLLRRRHRPGAHRRRHRLRADDSTSRATGDIGFLVREGIDILVETSRMWADLGFWRSNGERVVPHPRRHRAGRVHDGRQQQPVHQRDGPLQPRAGRRARSSWIRDEHPDDVRPGRRRGSASTTTRSRSGARCAAGMTIPFDEGLGIHPQDDFFLDREVWDLSQTPRRAAAAAAALPPAGDLPVPGAQAGRRRARAVPPGRPVHRARRSAPTSSTTTRSPPATRRCRRSCSRSSRPRSATTRSRCDYFLPGAVRRPANLHGNTVDGLHVASTGGVWSALVVRLRRDARPRRRAVLRPAAARRRGRELRFRLCWRGTPGARCS